MKIKTIYKKHLEIFLDNPSNIFLFSDPHFDHTNIISYCNRPFSSKEKMNEVLMHNYNSVVKDDSLVLFLGDMAYGRESKEPAFWLSQLKGKIIYFKGSHDHGIHVNEEKLNTLNICTSAELFIGQYHFYLLHNPEEIPVFWENWTIHGHMHNTAPLFDFENKRICVSAENTNYTPISLEKIIESIRNKS